MICFPLALKLGNATRLKRIVLWTKSRTNKRVHEEFLFGHVLHLIKTKSQRANPPFCAHLYRERKKERGGRLGQICRVGWGGVGVVWCVVIAVCRWRVCESCWLWTCPCGRGWTRSWSAGLISASVLPVPSRSHKPVWLGRGFALRHTLPPALLPPPPPTPLLLDL